MPAAVLDAPRTATSGSSVLLREAAFGEVDFVTEMKLRTWARQRYCNAGARQPDWHPVILDEMERIDREAEA
ncbi:hypothetical protein [Alienimonas sp. DA493]|uniref:hypothetical protein n=1 Tax=Alienimonas sp. DA493 TaxID=3373605 RepID=UPI003754FD4C